MESLVEGEVVFEASAPPIRGGTLYVALEDVSYADAPARVMARYVARDVDHDPQAPAPLRFRLAGPPPDPRARYVVSAHVDVDGDGAVTRGDFISMQSYPVLTHGYPTVVTVEVRQV